MFFAESETANVLGLGGVVTIFVGLVAWVLKSALPALLQTYRDDTATIRREFRDELAAFRSDLKEMAKANAATCERLGVSIEKLADEITVLKESHNVCAR